METWAGVDVGGRRKGFHAAVIDRQRLLAGPARLASVEKAVQWLACFAPALTAVDSPIEAPPDDHRWRECERSLSRAVCGIRWTPSMRALEGRRDYYEWIIHGLELYAALHARGLAAVECFPTASWTRWAGKRRTGTSRAAWTKEALQTLELAGIPARTNQDERDAIAAAVTARLHTGGGTQMFGEIAVPL